MNGRGAIAADKKGNLYVGGAVTSAVFVNTDTLTSVGGCSDFFVAKYGYDNCSDSTSTLNVSQNGTQANMSVYPNPVLTTLHITNAVPGTRFAIYDMYGRLQLEGTVRSYSFDISVAPLPAGSYALKLTDNNNSIKEIVLVKL